MKRKPAKPRAIKIVLEEHIKWEGLIFQFFKDSNLIPDTFKTYKTNHPTEEGDVALLGFTKQIVNECEIGWGRAPKNFQSRIKLKTGWNSPLRGKKFNRKEEIASTKDEEISSGFNIRDSLTKEEAKFFDERLDEYVKDFEFNSSSDLTLVKRLVLEEIVHERLMIAQLQCVTMTKKNGKFSMNSLSEEVDDGLTNSHKRMIELQKQLGISRMQRADEMNKGSNNIAEIALNLDEKLNKFPIERKRLEDEEQYYTKLKELEEPINIIPPQQVLENMISNATSTEIYNKIIDNKLKDEYKEEKIVPEELPGGLTL